MLVILLINLIGFASAKIVNMPSLYTNNDVDHSGDVLKYKIADVDRIWVLPLTKQEYDTMKLRLATDEEVDMYMKNAGPIIERLNANVQYPRVKKDEPKAYTADKTYSGRENKMQNDFSLYEEEEKNNEIQSEIYKLLNKLVLSLSSESNDMAENTGEDTSTPKFKIYFQGMFASIFLQQGLKIRKYVIYPSPFPDWFHEDHDFTNNSLNPYVEVPQKIRNEFLNILLNLLQTYLRYIM